MKWSQCDFIDAEYAVKPLDVSAPSELATVILLVQQHRAVFFIGSGISAAAPAAVPTGKKLAELMADELRRIGQESLLAGIDQTDLGDVCQVIENVANRDAMLAELRKHVREDVGRFNLAHWIIALLFAEGWLTKSFTTNWDDGIDSAAQAARDCRRKRYNRR